MTTIQIVRKKLDPAEVGGANTRYSSDCDCTQSTPDGGTTWVDNPALDPRHSTALQMPARTTSDPQCDAAANMVAYLRHFIDTIVTVSTQGAGASAILGILIVFMPEVAILWSLALEVMGGLLSIGQSTINAAFTDPVYDQLENIFYCNINSDGTVTAEQLDIIGAKIASEIGGVVQAVLALYLPLLGEVGLSNSGATGSEVGDCSGFACGWCESQHFAVSDNGYSIVSGEGGTYSAGVGFIGTNLNAGNNTDVGVEIVITPTQLTYVRFHIYITAGDGPNYGVGMRLWDGATLVYNGLVGGGSTGDYIHTFGSPTTIDKIQMFVNAGSSGGSTGVTDAHIEGVGTNPFSGIADNCDD